MSVVCICYLLTFTVTDIGSNDNKPEPEPEPDTRGAQAGQIENGLHTGRIQEMESPGINIFRSIQLATRKHEGTTRVPVSYTHLTLPTTPYV